MQVVHNSKVLVHMLYLHFSVLDNASRFFVSNIAIIHVRCTTPLESFVLSCYRVCVRVCVCVCVAQSKWRKGGQTEEEWIDGNSTRSGTSCRNGLRGMPTAQTRTTVKVRSTGEPLLSVDGRSQVAHVVHLEPLLSPAISPLSQCWTMLQGFQYCNNTCKMYNTT